jgi:hypothetical protein
VEEAIGNHLSPDTFRHPIATIVTTNGTVVAINVPPHPELVAFWPKRCHSIEYLHRTNHGKAWMNPDEAKAQMGNQFRAIQIDAKRVFEQCVARPANLQPFRLEIVPPIKRQGYGQSGVFGFEPDPTAYPSSDGRLRIGLNSGGC